MRMDGDRTQDVMARLQRLPHNASYLVVSVGGNEALEHLASLTESAKSVAEVLGRLAQIGEPFEHAYYGMVQGVLQHSLPTALCIIYHLQFPAQELQSSAITALTIFNNLIILGPSQWESLGSICG